MEFEWRQELIPREGRDLGFIAQELEEVVPEVVSNNGQRLSVGVSSLNALLVEAIKNLNSKFKDDKSLFFEFMSEFCSEQKNSSLCQKVNL